MMNYERKTDSFRGKEVFPGSPFRQAVPILMRSRTPTKEKVSTPRSGPLSPRRYTPMSLSSRQSSDIRDSLKDITALKLEGRDPDIMGKRQIGTPTRHTENMVYTTSPNDPDIRNAELGRLLKRHVTATVPKQDDGVMHKIHFREREPSFRVHNQGAESSPSTPTVSSPRIGGKNRTSTPTRTHNVIGEDPNSHMKSTPIYATNKPGVAKVVILPSSSERFVDDNGFSTLHTLERKKETEIRSTTPTGRKHHNEPVGNSNRVISHHAERLANQCRNHMRKVEPAGGSAGNILLNTTQRDFAKVESLHAMSGPPQFIPDPKVITPQRMHISRSGSARRPDNDIFNKGSTPAPSPLRTLRLEGRSHANSPIRKSGEWEP